MLYCGRGLAKQRFSGLITDRKCAGAAAHGTLAVSCGDKVARKPKKAKKAKKEAPSSAQVTAHACPVMRYSA